MPRVNLKPLHDINAATYPVYSKYADVSGKRIVDVGCGGGILNEGLAKIALMFWVSISVKN